MSASYSELFRVFGRIGILSFGGPAAQIALMYKELVEERDWLTEDEFLQALSFCMLLPGPEAMQLATYAGWQQRGILGGIISGLLFVLPGACVIAVLAIAYGLYGNLDWVKALFLGVQAAVIVIVLDALRKIATTTLTSRRSWGIAGTSFVALYCFSTPFPLVIAAAGCFGWFAFNIDQVKEPKPTPPLVEALPVLTIGVFLWLTPLFVSFVLGFQFLTELALFFSKMAVVSFGGAYAVLGYMSQVVVSDFQWLDTQEMLDALGLAETTPGPLILVTQFVAMLAGLSQGSVGVAILAGILTLWVTFVPCFIWIFVGAPYLEWISTQAKLKAALNGIMAAVVGVIANLSVWFAMHVIFNETFVGPFNVLYPNLDTINIAALFFAGLAMILLRYLKQSLLRVLLACAFAALGFSLFSS